MLDTLTYQVPAPTVKSAAAAPSPINGHGRRAFKHLSKSQRAAIGVAILRGEVGLQPTLGVVSRALGVSVTYIETASKLAPEVLREVRKGRLALADLKSARAPESKSTVTPDDVATWWWGASESDRAAVVSKVGVASTWDALARNLV